jgi:hypothetical protein
MPNNALHWTVRCGALGVANAQNKFVFAVRGEGRCAARERER